MAFYHCQIAISVLDVVADRILLAFISKVPADMGEYFRYTSARYACTPFTTCADSARATAALRSPVFCIAGAAKGFLLAWNMAAESARECREVCRWVVSALKYIQVYAS
jgi:hypothetical protein